MSFNKDELEAPEWINSDFFKMVLENSEKLESVKINDYKISPATMLGDHFASIMFRVRIQYSSTKNSNGNISIIVKTLPEVEGFKKEVLGNFDLFERESLMYTKVLPNCVEILKNCGIPDLFAPRLLYHSLNPHKVIVFEDLKELGYFMYPTNSPSEKDLKLIFAKLAQMHATTFKMEADGNTEITKLVGTCFSMPNIVDMDLFKSGTELLLEAIKTIPELKLCADKMKKFKPNALLNKVIESVTVPGCYNVLNHGDYHIKNMMFKNNEQKDISEVVLVDFQLCHWGSPAYDLLYMFSIVPYNSRNEMMEYYFKYFIDILIKTGFKGKLPTIDQLREELHKLRHLDLFMIASFAPFITLEIGENDFEMEEVMTSKDSRISFYKTKKYVSLIKEMLPIFLEQGHFDDIINEK